MAYFDSIPCECCLLSCVCLSMSRPLNSRQLCIPQLPGWQSSVTMWKFAVMNFCFSTFFSYASGKKNLSQRIPIRHPGSEVLEVYSLFTRRHQTLGRGVCEGGAEGLGGGFLKGPLLVSLQTSGAYEKFAVHCSRFSSQETQYSLGKISDSIFR